MRAESHAVNGKKQKQRRGDELCDKRREMIHTLYGRPEGRVHMEEMKMGGMYRKIKKRMGNWKERNNDIIVSVKYGQRFRRMVSMAVGDIRERQRKDELMVALGSGEIDIALIQETHYVHHVEG